MLWKTNVVLIDVAEARTVPKYYSFIIPRPKSDDLKNNLGEIYNWCCSINKCEQEGLLSVTEREIRNCGIGGKQQIPRKVEIELWKALELIHKTSEAQKYIKLLTETEARLPQLIAHLKSRPRYFLNYSNIWSQCLNVCLWILEHPQPKIFIREAPIPQIDTKFVESNKALLLQLFEVILPDNVKNIQVPADTAHFEERYGFLKKSDSIRLRLPLGNTEFPSTVSEVRVLVKELAETIISCTEVIVIENEITFLTMPRRKDRLIIWGMGYADVLLETVTWLKNKKIIYWGDIDTHGFKILSKLREYFAQTESMLMDKDTLKYHLERDICVEEVNPIVTIPACLNEKEIETFKSLSVDCRHLRLEQERIDKNYLKEII